MHKQLSLFVLSLIIVGASLAGVVFLWWQSTPQYCLLEVRRAYREKDQDDFNKYVDVANLVSSFSEEVLFNPAEKTPGLTKVQRMIGLSALEATRLKIDNSLIFQVQRLVKEKDQDNLTSSNTDSGTADDGVRYAEPPPQKMTNVISQEWQKEKKRIKDHVYQRMLDFAGRCPEKIIYRVLAAPTGTRATAVKDIIAECGLVGKNFKRYKLEYIGPKVVAHLYFMSPRVNKEISLRLELERVREGPLGSYRVSRLIAFKDTLKELGYHTDEEVQSLLAYGLADLNKETLTSAAKTLIKNVGQSAARNKEKLKALDSAPATTANNAQRASVPSPLP